jgi:hypothetical protein
MKDFNKLKYAHELCNKHPNKYIVAHLGKHGPLFKLINLDESSLETFEDIDELIDALTDTPDTVWFLNRKNLPEAGVIKGRCNDKFLVNSYVLSEKEIFETRNELIEAQIEYWSTMHE